MKTTEWEKNSVISCGFVLLNLTFTFFFLGILLGETKTHNDDLFILVLCPALQLCYIRYQRCLLHHAATSHCHVSFRISCNNIQYWKRKGATQHIVTLLKAVEDQLALVENPGQNKPLPWTWRLLTIPYLDYIYIKLLILSLWARLINTWLCVWFPEHCHNRTTDTGSQESNAQLTQLLITIPGNGLQDAHHF